MVTKNKYKKALILFLVFLLPLIFVSLPLTKADNISINQSFIIVNEQKGLNTEYIDLFAQRFFEEQKRIANIENNIKRNTGHEIRNNKVFEQHPRLRQKLFETNNNINKQKAQRTQFFFEHRNKIRETNSLVNNNNKNEIISVYNQNRGKHNNQNRGKHNLGRN